MIIRDLLGVVVLKVALIGLLIFGMKWMKRDVMIHFPKNQERLPFLKEE